MSVRLIQEMTENYDVINETVEGKKRTFIQGVFFMGEEVNKNGRSYPLDVLENAIGQYQNEYVSRSRALGELNHPTTPTVNLDRIALVIEELVREGKDYVGKARVLPEQPMGKILNNLLAEGIQLAVSSRGTGGIKRKNNIDIVENNFRISAVDAVHDPSAFKAFVNSVMENTEWVYDIASDSWESHKIIEDIQREGHKNIKVLKDEAKALKWFSLFTESISKKTTS